MERMETVSTIVDRLTARGFTATFRAKGNGLTADGSSRIVAPEKFRIDEIARYEGDTDPGDETIVFALECTETGERGTYVVPYGPAIPPHDAEAVRRLSEIGKRRA